MYVLPFRRCFPETHKRQVLASQVWNMCSNRFAKRLRNSNFAAFCNHAEHNTLLSSQSKVIQGCPMFFRACSDTVNAMFCIAFKSKTASLHVFYCPLCMTVGGSSVMSHLKMEVLKCLQCMTGVSMYPPPSGESQVLQLFNAAKRVLPHVLQCLQCMNDSTMFSMQSYREIPQLFFR